MEFSTPESHVHLGLPALLEFRRGRADDEPLVLATVIATEGSTYRKPGAMMLIAGDGAFAGLISGGCLEGDLAQHAQAVFASGEPAQLTYDMSAGDDLVGIGGGIYNLDSATRIDNSIIWGNTAGQSAPEIYDNSPLNPPLTKRYPCLRLSAASAFRLCV